ncbi:transposase [Aneurinibacillus sp. XH2]|uniref:RNA-guided endonuclease InsQ/TnpB family protein n=1 Tax=Aneurinibacillus sp. XH2 TaxID=1450761 RepID=UPI00070C3110|nr:RNA-guided endonuclease TnpB family protein [Aneurinibacillus sp. XH2]AMA74214.1 transposase [Aneurinibacillus sp. XH2]
MIRTAKVAFTASRSTIDALFALHRFSAEVWNTCLAEAKVYHQQTGQWIGKTELQKRLKRRFPMHSQSIQAVCHKYLWARDSAHQARKEGHTNVRYPYKQKKYFNTKWAADGFTIHPNVRISLSRGIWEGKRQAPNPPGSHTCAIDPGEIHTLAAVATTGDSLIVTGRKIRSIHRLRNKKLAELQRKMSKCQKYSLQWKRYNRAKQYLLSKSKRQLQDALHKTTKQFVEWVVAQQVNEVYLGDVEGVQRKKKKKRSRCHNQRMSQWQVGKVKKYPTYKLKAEGIMLHKRKERYTSQTCPVCGAKKNVRGRMYRCSCGYTQHRDIHGAANLLSKVLYENRIQSLPFEIQKPTYLRIA